MVPAGLSADFSWGMLDLLFIRCLTCPPAPCYLPVPVALSQPYSVICWSASFHVFLREGSWEVHFRDPLYLKKYLLPSLLISDMGFYAAKQFLWKI